jgi:hypothetical protein
MALSSLRLLQTHSPPDRDDERQFGANGIEVLESSMQVAAPHRAHDEPLAREVRGVSASSRRSETPHAHKASCLTGPHLGAPGGSPRA